MTDKPLKNAQLRLGKKSVFIKQNKMFRTHQKSPVYEKNERRSVIPPNKSPLPLLSRRIHMKVTMLKKYKKRRQNSYEPSLNFQKDWKNDTFNCPKSDLVFQNCSNNSSKEKEVFSNQSILNSFKNTKIFKPHVKLRNKKLSKSRNRAENFSSPSSFLGSPSSQYSTYDHSTTFKNNTNDSNLANPKYYFDFTQNGEISELNQCCINVTSYLKSIEDPHQMRKRISQQIKTWKFSKTMKNKKRNKAIMRPTKILVIPSVL
ncbi:unnamed protein product [Moneuplotes crassus]|uniref:Uncharacterized protein n=1 Tax=Euplotes crassus TaxID=5936 RepID=A0AAD1XA37_EUPCR|nr:unnamed protein product [Moneuplotes crassus]